VIFAVIFVTGVATGIRLWLFQPKSRHGRRHRFAHRVARVSAITGNLFNLTPWYPGWFAGMPAYTYYFVLPDLLGHARQLRDHVRGGDEARPPSSARADARSRRT